MITNAFDELKWRGLIFDHIEGVPELLAKEKVTVYNGFDPTADSLHVGHIVPLIATGAPAALWPHAHRGGGRRHRHDRRPERQIRRAQPAHPRADRVQRGLHQEAAGPPAGFRGQEQPGPPAQQRRLAAARSTWSISCATPASISRSTTCSPRIRSRTASSAKKGFPSPSSATCCSSPTTSCTCSTRWAASCRPAAATSGATSPPGWS